MQTVDIVKRIFQLKKVSMDLKQSTQNLDQSGSDFVRGILEMSKKYSNGSGMQSPTFPHHETESNSRKYQSLSKKQVSPLMALINQIPNNGQTSKRYQSAQKYQSGMQKYSKLFQNQMSRESQKQMSTTEQIQKIQKQNIKLSEKLQKMKQQLRKLEQIQRQQKQEQWKDGLPYFTLNHPQLKAFCTKLKISENDYSKIDFTDYSVSLSLEHIILTPIKPSYKNQHKKVQSPTTKKKNILLHLSSLTQVQYPSINQFNRNNFDSYHHNFNKIFTNSDQLMIIYHFKSDAHPSMNSYSQVLQSLFLKFDTEQERDQWDIAIYVNFKILNNLKPNKQKKQAIQDSHQKNNTQPTKRFEQLKKQLHLSDGISKISNKPAQNHKQETPFLKQFNWLESPNKNTNKLKNFESFEAHPSQGSQDEDDSEIQTQNQKQTDKNREQEKLIENQRKIKQEQQLRKKQEQRERQQQDRKRQEEKRRRQEEQRRQIQRIKQEQRIAEQKKKKELEKKQEEEKAKIYAKMQRDAEIKVAKDKLKKGFILIKYAKGAFNPHEKRVYLDPQQSKLCWRDKDNLDFKSIMIEQITQIQQGVFGPGIEKHENIKKIKIKNCFCLISLKSDERPSLQFGAKDLGIMDNFVQSLRLCLSAQILDPSKILF